MRNNTPKIFSYLVPSFGSILWAAVFFGALSLGPRMMNLDGDLGRHLVLGGYILDHGAIPLHDLFSHTMFGKPLTPHEWLAEVIFALSFRLLGMDGVILVSALLISTTFWLVFMQMRAMNRTLIPVVLVALLAIASSSLHWLTRPHLFTFLFLALWMRELTDLSSGKRKRWWLLPVLMLIWVNLHGAFIAGFVTWFFYGLGLLWDEFKAKFGGEKTQNVHLTRSYLSGGVLAFMTSFINPSGIELWKTSLGYIGNEYLVDHTMEYLSPNFHEPGTWPFLLFIVLLLFVLGKINKKFGTGLILTSVIWLAMGLYSARNIPLFAIVAAPLLAYGLDELFFNTPIQLKFISYLKILDTRLRNIDLSIKGVFWPIFCIFITILGFRSGYEFDLNRTGNSFDPRVFPVEAANWLDDHQQTGEMFNYFPWGGYLLFREWPNHLVFIDGQTDFYGETFTREYEQVISQKNNWENVIEKYQIDWAILPAGEPAVLAFRSDLNWEVIYEDDTAVILRGKN